MRSKKRTIMQCFSYQNIESRRTCHHHTIYAHVPSVIANTILEQWQEQARITACARSEEMSKQERVRLWREDQAQYDITEFSHAQLDTTNSDFTTSSELTAQAADCDTDTECISDADPAVDLSFVTTSQAYTWLTLKLGSYLQLSSPNFSALTKIKQEILDCFLRPSRVNRKTPHLLYTMNFNLNWAVIEFLDSYHFGGMSGAERILGTFVTLTSDGNNIQALTAPQYLSQTWPLIGEEILSLIIKTIDGGHISSKIFGSEVVARLLSRRICLEVTGSIDSIVEVGQILGWIGAVFQASPVEGNVYQCTPSITISNGSQNRSSKDCSCTIEYALDVFPSGTASNDCWHSLFKYAVIAQMFPILHRPRSVRGLEMDLSMMLALCHAKHVGKFRNKITIKGFSSILSLSERQKGASVWHFSRSASIGQNEYMSYSNAIGGREHRDLAVQEVLLDRHFVGWCSQFRYGAGMPRLNILTEFY